MKTFDFTVVVFRENNSFSAWSPDLDVASQGDTQDEAIANLKEAMVLHLECLNSSELSELKKQQSHKLMTTVEVALA